MLPIKKAIGLAAVPVSPIHQADLIAPQAQPL